MNLRYGLTHWRISQAQSTKVYLIGGVRDHSLFISFQQQQQLTWNHNTLGTQLIADLREALRGGEKAGGILECHSVASLFHASRFKSFVKYVVFFKKVLVSVYPFINAHTHTHTSTSQIYRKCG